MRPARSVQRRAAPTQYPRSPTKLQRLAQDRKGGSPGSSRQRHSAPPPGRRAAVEAAPVAAPRVEGPATAPVALAVGVAASTCAIPTAALGAISLFRMRAGPAGWRFMGKITAAAQAAPCSTGCPRMSDCASRTFRTTSKHSGSSGRATGSTSLRREQHPGARVPPSPDTCPLPPPERGPGHVHRPIGIPSCGLIVTLLESFRAPCTTRRRMCWSAGDRRKAGRAVLGMSAAAVS